MHKRQLLAIAAAASLALIAGTGSALAQGYPSKAVQFVVTAGPGSSADIVARILKEKDPVKKMKALRESTNPQAQFLWAIFRDIFHYAAVQLESVADNARDLDLAMRWGFGWTQGPFETWQAAGWSDIAQAVAADIAAFMDSCDFSLATTERSTGASVSARTVSKSTAWTSCEIIAGCMGASPMSLRSSSAFFSALTKASRSPVSNASSRCAGTRSSSG